MSAVASAAYRAGERLVDAHDGGKVYDFTHKTHVTHKEILLPDRVPDQLADRSALWNRVETTLNHKRGQPAFEVEVALPRELSHEQHVELARGFAQREFVDQGLIVDMSMHMSSSCAFIFYMHMSMLHAYAPTHVHAHVHAMPMCHAHVHVHAFVHFLIYLCMYPVACEHVSCKCEHWSKHLSI